VYGTHARASALVFVHESMGSESMWSITQTHGPTLVCFSPFSRLLRDCIYAISEQGMVLRDFSLSGTKVEQIVSHPKYIYIYIYSIQFKLGSLEVDLLYCARNLIAKLRYVICTLTQH